MSTHGSGSGLSMAGSGLSVPPRIVEEINGVLYCGCLEDINSGLPCRHIQCVKGCAFSLNQFHPHWHRIESVDICSTVPCESHNALSITNSSIEPSNTDQLADAQGVFVQDFASLTAELPLPTAKAVIFDADSISGKSTLNSSKPAKKQKVSYYLRQLF